MPHPAVEVDAFGAAHARLAVLRACGAAAVDAVGLARAEALCRRGTAQDAAVRAWLAPRLTQAIDMLARRVEAAAAAPATNADSRAGNRPAWPVRVPDGRAGDELDAARRLRPTLARLRTERQVAHALAREPERPGPLNSEHLLLRAMREMQRHAPALLGAFVGQAETLLWLDAARGVAASAPAPRSTPRKTARRNGA